MRQTDLAEIRIFFQASYMKVFHFPRNLIVVINCDITRSLRNNVHEVGGAKTLFHDLRVGLLKVHIGFSTQLVDN